MSLRCRDSLEFELGLPLGVLANQLMKIEADLRFLNMKALAFASDAANPNAALHVGDRLDLIREALDRIHCLVSDIESDLQPKPVGSAASSKTAGAAKSIPDRDD